ncbi:hypothetical protein JHD50_08150 [Sulfurimonas sp. MAG313]|nr:hypothetical protein [Sulfurimonas sp. MAG313]MDF1881272.1 hypothetical protein [Sulfurimonas sp. MAG313]
MKLLDKKMQPILEICSALMLYADKGWKTKFDTQLDKLELNKLSAYKFEGGSAVFRYDGFSYIILDDRIIYRSLNSADEYTIKKSALDKISFIL